MNPKTTYAGYENNTDNLVVYKSGERQRRPYNLMCKLNNLTGRRVLRGKSLSRNYPNLEGWTFMDHSGHLSDSARSGISNLAYKRMVDQLGDASSLGATLTAEGRKSWHTVVSIVTRCLRAARNVRKLHFGAAARDLGLPYHERDVVIRRRTRLPNGKYRTFKIRRKQFQWHEGKWYAAELGSGWLMYSYGVKPLMQDIYNGLDVLQRPLPFIRIKGGARGHFTVHDRWNGPGQQTHWTSEYSVRQSVDVGVANPNLWLCNRLGLVNPLQWIWEAVPFSFVVDWFSNVQEVINSFSDFTGLETANACTNIRWHLVEDVNNYYSSNDWISYELSMIQRFRSLDLTLPHLRFAYERFEWQRGANAISLLLQVLRS